MLHAKDKMFYSTPASHPFLGQKRTWHQSNIYSHHPQENRVQYDNYERDMTRKAGKARLSQNRFKPSSQTGERYFSVNKVLTPSHDIHTPASTRRIAEATAFVQPTVKATSPDDLSHRLTCRRLNISSEAVKTTASEMCHSDTLEEGELSFSTSHQPDRSDATNKLLHEPLTTEECSKHFIVLDSYSYPDDCEASFSANPVLPDEYPGIYDHPEPFVDLYLEFVPE